MRRLSEMIFPKSAYSQIETISSGSGAKDRDHILFIMKFNKNINKSISDSADLTNIPIGGRHKLFKQMKTGIINMVLLSNLILRQRVFLAALHFNAKIFLTGNTIIVFCQRPLTVRTKNLFCHYLTSMRFLLSYTTLGNNSQYYLIFHRGTAFRIKEIDLWDLYSNIRNLGI